MRRARLARILIAANLLALAAAYASGQWDAAEHAKGAVDPDTFWYAPHYGIYVGIFGAALFSIAALVLLLRAPGGLRAKLRENAALGLVAAANAIGFSGAPLDAWYHAVHGIDLSVWSPPHLHLLFGLALASVACSVHFLDDAAPNASPRVPARLSRQTWMAMLAITLGLLLGAYLFFEYEAALPNVEVLARPAWTYPVTWTLFATFAIALPVSTTRVWGSATLMAAIFLVARFAVLAVDRTALGFRSAAPVPIIVPALAFDAAMYYIWPRFGRRRWLAVGLLGVVSSAAVVATTWPFWLAFSPIPQLTAYPWESSWPAALLAGFLGTFGGWAAGVWFRLMRPASRPEPAAGVEAA